VIPTIVTQALANEAIRLGNISPTRDLNYVADTVEGFIKAAESSKAVGEVINLGTGREISIGELAATILRTMGKDLQVITDSERIRPGGSEVERLCADANKARELLGWEPKHSLEEGLTRTVEWIRENNERFRLGVYTI
jgi:dTDP-glucose 4,6-dehydratase